MRTTRRAWNERFEMACNGEENGFGELTVHGEGGLVLPVEMAITALTDGEWFAVSRDLTERIRAEQARAEAESKYQHDRRE